MKRVMLWFCGTCMGLPGESQAWHALPENDFISMGAYSIHYRNAFSFQSNVASLGTCANFSTGIVTEQQWMLRELTDLRAALSFPLANGGCGIGLRYSGDEGYLEKALDLAYAKSLGRLDLGIRFNYLSADAAGYTTADFGSSGIGIRLNLSARLITGWELEIPVLGRQGKLFSERDAAQFRMGMGYEWSPEVFMTVGMTKSQGIPVDVSSTLEYRFEEQFFVSFGISSLAGSMFFSSGWKKNKLTIEIYTRYEPVMGFSPGLLMLWERKNISR